MKNYLKESTVAYKLREGTKLCHQRLERCQLPQDLMSHELTLDRYSNILKAWYSSWFGLEQWLTDNQPNNNYANILVPFPRTPLLSTDLLSLNQSVPNIRVFNPIVDLDKESYWYGVAYVLEGSHMGNRLIAKHLSAKLGLTKNNGAAYFMSDSFSKNINHPRLSWSEWSALLNKIVNNQGAVKSAIKGASDTFDYMIDGFANYKEVHIRHVS